MDYLEERKLNLRDMNLKHIEGEVYEFQGVRVDMEGCGLTHFQMYRHIATQLAKKIQPLSSKAKRWDRLGKQISKCYNNADGEYDEDNPEIEDSDLCTIGEMAASAFGYI